MKKVRFPIGIWRIPGFRCNFSSPAAKKREPKDSTLPRWGVKKRRVFYSPKRIFCKGRRWENSSGDFKHQETRLLKSPLLFCAIFSLLPYMKSSLLMYTLMENVKNTLWLGVPKQPEATLRSDLWNPRSHFAHFITSGGGGGGRGRKVSNSIWNSCRCSEIL